MNRTRRALLWALAGAAPGAFWLARWFQNRAALEQGQLAAMDADQQFDVCIAGSGPAGAILACDLARRGFKTLIVEAGGLRDEGIAVARLGRVEFERRADGIPAGFAYPIDATRSIGPGGTSHVWGGFCPRFRPIDFARPSGESRDAWPIRYDELEPYYARAERELAVDVGDANEILFLTDAMREAGYSFEATPLSQWDKQPIDIAQSHLPEYRRSASATLVTDARVTRIVSAADGRVASLEVRSVAGVTRQVRARAYVLAAGGIETPRLLLLSRSREHPAGIGNRHDMVGRHFMEHLQTAADGWRGSDVAAGVARPVEAISWQFYEEFKAAGCGGMILECQSPQADLRTLGLSPIVEMESSPDNRVHLDATRMDPFGNPAAAIILKLSPRDLKTLARADEVTRQMFSKVGLTSHRSSGRVVMLHHHMGTCRMASDPQTGVVDANLRVHGTENLYVAGSASFPTSSAAPPTLTIVALSLRLADHLAATLS